MKWRGIYNCPHRITTRADVISSGLRRRCPKIVICVAQSDIRCRQLIFPFTLPMFLVDWAVYTTNYELSVKQTETRHKPSNLEHVYHSQLNRRYQTLKPPRAWKWYCTTDPFGIFLTSESLTEHISVQVWRTQKPNRHSSWLFPTC